ncbi:MAG TPA: SDR family NAD(P)-dependent oxidoreductase [Motilibacterales bacterium]|nr:SDR family NAD(P)-dependent oxidoreductase [Motilibacterales bacterium]
MVFRVPITLPPVVRDLMPGVVSGPDVEATGRRVLITGASGTFGRAIATALTARGAHVVGLDLAPRGDDPVDVVACDITDRASVEATVAVAVAKLGGLDILINNAGIGGPAPAELPPGSEVHRQLEINVLGAWRVTAAARDALVESRGRVVVVASRASVFPLPIAAAYGASKRAVVAWADALRLELAPWVSVSTVYPSMVRSPIHDSTKQAGLSLEGVSHFEPLEGVVDAILAAALARTAPRDVATSPRGTVEFLLARHVPSLVDVLVRRTVERRLDTGAFDGAPLAAGMVGRHRGKPAI